MNMNWQDREKETRRCEIVIRAILNKWLEDNNDWVGEVIFSNYPPVLYIKLEIHHLNNLSDVKMSQAGDLVTSLCNFTKMKCSRAYKPSSNAVAYKLFVPFS